MNNYYTLDNARKITEMLNNLLDTANECGINVIAPFKNGLTQFEFHVVVDEESGGFCIGAVDID